MIFFYIPEPPDKNYCVIKLYYATKYVIIKAKNVKSSCQIIQKSLNQYLRGSDAQQDKGNLYIHLFAYIKEHPDKDFKIKIILQDENIYHLLKSEQQELDKARFDKNCLNNNTDAYLPLFNEDTNSYGWVPMNAYLNFKKWLKNKTA